MIRGIESAVNVGGKRYGESPDTDVSYRAVADEARAVSFLIVEGLRPGKGDREYVLRRLIRRATRHARRIEAGNPYQLLRSACEAVVQVMGGAYKEVVQEQSTIFQV